MTKKKQKFDMEKLFDPFETPGPSPVLHAVRTDTAGNELAYWDADGRWHSVHSLLSYKCEHGQLLNLDGCDTCELLGNEVVEVTKLREEVACLQGELERVKDERDKLQDECDALQNELYADRGH